jgi:simple sugar transport system substrate-binding protein
MKKRILLVALMLLSIGFVVLAGGQKEPSGKVKGKGQYVIGYLVPNMAEGQIIFMNSFKKYAEQLGMKVIDVNAQNKADRQDTQCSDLIAQKVDALVMVPVDSQTIVSAVDRASQAGIPVFGIDRQPFSPKTVMTVMSNNYLAGQQAAQYIVGRLKEKYGEARGTVLEITGDLGTNVAQLRGQGFTDEMKKYPNIMVNRQPTDWLPEHGARVVQDTLASTPDLDAVYWHSDFTGAGVVPAMQEVGYGAKVGEPGHIIICGIDGDAAALDRIRAGTQDATVNQPMTDFGILAQYVKKYLDGEKLTTGTYTQAGARWSPATIEQTKYGLTMLLATWVLTKDNVEDPTLWGNLGKK